MTEEQRIEFLKNNIQEIDERISYLTGEILELQGYKTKCIEELHELGYSDIDTDVLYCR